MHIPAINDWYINKKIMNFRVVDKIANIFCLYLIKFHTHYADSYKVFSDILFDPVYPGPSLKF